MKALSIRQPWAWLIIHAGKNIENRTWKTSYRGPIYIHASKSITAGEYLAAICFASDALKFPNPTQWVNWLTSVPESKDMLRGGIIGTAEIVDCVTQSDSPWFTGPHGFVLANARPLDFIPCKGSLGFFTPDAHPTRK